MRRSDFTKSAPGRFARTTDGAWAFVPHPLPPKLPVDWALIKKLSEADRALAELRGVGSKLLNPRLLIDPFIRREAILSSQIEGTQTTLSQLYRFEARLPGDVESDTQEVSNYVRALQQGLEQLERLPLGSRLIRSTHRVLLEGVRGADQAPGRYRRVQNWIGPEGCKISDATYVPPPPQLISEAISDLEKFIHLDSDLPPLIKLALIHYEFEAIHPFFDGNGRVGRLLLMLFLCAEDLLTEPLLYLSAYFVRHKREYYEHLLNVSQRGEWLPWIGFFLRGVIDQAKDAKARSDRLLDLQQRYRERLQSARASALLLKLVDHLIQSPWLNARMAAARLEITFGAAQKNIEKLIAHEILEEATGRSRNRVYVAREIIDAIESDIPGA